MAVVLLSAAAMLTQTFVRIALTPTGFSSAGVLTAQVMHADRDDARRTQFYVQLSAELAAIPGVHSVGLINGVPIRFTGGGSGFQIDDDKKPVHFSNGHHRIVGAGYFSTMAIPLIRGRVFTGAEHKDSEGVVVVSRSFAASAWPDTNAVGRRIRWGADGSWLRVIGVVEDVRLLQSVPPEPHVYFPFTQVQYAPYTPSDVVIKTTRSVAEVATALRAVVARLDPNQPVANVISMDDLIARSLGRRRFTLSLMAAFAGLALVLCAVGIYGLLSYSVRRRTREIGIRMAVGSTARRVRYDVLRWGLRLTLAGVLIGTALSWLLATWLSARVPGLVTPGIVPLIGASTLLVIVSACACDLPARCAMRVDPMIALRGE